MEIGPVPQRRMPQPRCRARILFPVLASALAVNVAGYALADPHAPAAGDIGGYGNGRSQEGLMIADVIARSARQLDATELERFITGKTIIIRNTATGRSYSVFYSGDGNCVVRQSAGGKGSAQPVRDVQNAEAPGLPSTYAVTKDGKLWTVLDGRSFIVRIYKNGGTYLAIESPDGELPLPR